MKSKITAKEFQRKAKRPKRVLLPEFKALMAQPYVGNTQDDLDEVRGDR